METVLSASKSKLICIFIMTIVTNGSQMSCSLKKKIRILSQHIQRFGTFLIGTKVLCGLAVAQIPTGDSADHHAAAHGTQCTEHPMGY